MREWLTNLAGAQYVDAILWTAVALAGLLVLLIVVRMMRGFNSGTYVAGGRNRKTRLAVMDATAIDSHRRLVLVRRDDVEHLLLIGGAADVVVERDIRLFAPQRRAVLTGESAPEPPVQQIRAAEAPPAARQPAPAPAARAPEPAAPARPVPREPELRVRPPEMRPPQSEARPRSPEMRPPEAEMRPREAEVRAREPEMRPARFPVPPRPRLPAPAPSEDIDETLARELDLTLDPPPPLPAKAVSLDDEMTKLLGELSSHKR